MPRFLKIAAASFLAMILMSSVHARADVDPDPPSRVARLSYFSGDVSFQPGGVDDWTDAKLNRPLTTGDRLWTARDAKAELHIGNAALRLNSETSFTLANLSDARVQIQLAQGTLDVRVRQMYESETIEIDTPNFTLNLLRAGEYRIDVDNDHDVSWVTVRSGTAEANGSGQAVTVQPRQQVKFAGGNDRVYDVAGAPEPDNFDQWCQSRDVREDRAKSAQYVSRDVIGYEDLDEYGAWRTYGSYGRVWVPVSVSAGWAPYHYGHWAWVYPWGWTWIDDAPWGFAPFHYGRWVYAPFGWAWVPGSIHVRPVYAPALVAWIGGRNWGVGVSFGGGYGYGWLPLGPREPFIPWYRGSRNYWGRVNSTNTRINNTYITNVYNTYNTKVINNCRGDCDNMHNITNIKYANRMAPNGVTVVDRDALIHSRPVSRAAMKINSDALRNAPVVARLDATPTRTSALGGSREGARVSRPPQRAFERPVLTRTDAPRPTRFEDQGKSFGGKPFGEGDRAKPVSFEQQGRSVPRPDGRAGMEGRVPVVNPDRPARVSGPENGAPGGQTRRVVPKPPERVSGGVENAGVERTSRPEGGVTPERRVVPKPPEREASGRDVVSPERRVQRPENSTGTGGVHRPDVESRAGGVSAVPRSTERVPKPPQDSADRARVRTAEVPRERPIRVDRAPDAQPRVVRTSDRSADRPVRVERTVDSQPRAPRVQAQERPARVERSAPAPKSSPPSQSSGGSERGHNPHNR